VEFPFCFRDFMHRSLGKGAVWQRLRCGKKSTQRLVASINLDGDPIISVNQKQVQIVLILFHNKIYLDRMYKQKFVQWHNINPFYKLQEDPPFVGMTFSY
jgi:hypothetical protein